MYLFFEKDRFTTSCGVRNTYVEDRFRKVNSIIEYA
jgi:hypothetical protein